MELVSADRLSGLKESRLFFDGTLLVTNTTTPITTSSADLSLAPLGVHIIKGEADDNAGNSTSTEVVITPTTSFDATIQNIEHYEALGLLTALPRVKQSLITQIKAAKALATQYARKPSAKLKLAVNAILSALPQEIELLERNGKIDPRAVAHLKSAFMFLKIP